MKIKSLLQKSGSFILAGLLSLSVFGCGNEAAQTGNGTESGAVNSVTDSTASGSSDSGTSDSSGSSDSSASDTGSTENGSESSDAANDEDRHEVPSGELAESTVLADSTHVKSLGRAYFEENNNSLWMTMSASGAEFEFYGTSASVTFYGDNTALKMGGDKDSQARVAVYVNGERVLDEMLNQMESTFEVYTADEPSWVDVKVVKLSECANSTCGIKSITTTSIGEIRPVPDKDYLVEIIGDSITCGYGVDDEDRDHHFSTQTEDATKTYGYIMAENLDVDYSLVSYSGYGVVSGYLSSAGAANTASTIPQYYEKIGYSYQGYKGYMASDFEWTFEREPDVIVINLGTNDSSYTGSDAAKKAEFEAAYVEFLKQIRKDNPDAAILCTLGIMGDTLYTNITNAVSTYSSDTGDSNVYTMKFDVQSSSDGYAADWHPTFATHTKAADKLSKKIAEILGISY